MQITVKVINEQVRVSLRNVARAIPKSGIRVLMKLMKNAVVIITSYPPKPPESRYVRTGNYGGSFELARVGDVGVRLTSGLDYTVYVGGNAAGEGQAWMHEGRWMLIKEAIDEQVTFQLAAEAEADLGTIIRQEGMGT